MTRPDIRDKYFLKVTPRVDVPEEALRILRHAFARNMGSSLVPTAAEGNRILDVEIATYEMRHGFVRQFFGFMAGGDHIVSTINVRDAATDALLGRFVVESRNSGAQGGRGAEWLLQQHANRIETYVRTTRCMDRGTVKEPPCES